MTGETSSNRIIDEADGDLAEDFHDDKTLKQRFVENPGPGLRWAVVLFALLALEAGRFADGLSDSGQVFVFIYESVVYIPHAVGDNAGAALGSPVAGTVAFALTAFLLLVLVADPLIVRLPDPPAEMLGLSVNGYGRWADRVLVGSVLGVVAVLLAVTPVGTGLDATVAAIQSGLESLGELQTLTSRETIPNQGHRTPGGGWEGPFLGLSPALAWGLRVVVIFGYAFGLLAWLWHGYNVYREHYRGTDWTPFDDTVRRFRNHSWGLFGLVIVVTFFTMALWAPALTSVPIEHNHYEPYQHEVTYLEDGELQTTLHGEANMHSRSDGTASNVGPLSYDDYGRWAPAGTNSDGKDLFTFIVFGARTSLVIGLLTVSIGASLALAVAMITAYYKGLVDLLFIFTTDTFMSVPQFLVLLMLLVIFSEANHPIVEYYDGGVLMALIFAATLWPALWRSIRGPALQVAEEEWIDAAKSYGQRPGMIMRKHMTPYVMGYLLIYGSLILGSIVIQTAALSFLGVGVAPPTPEWGRMIADGRPFIATQSWHIATIMGFLIVFLVLGFNALGDAIRDAIDAETSLDGDTVGGGGGGA
jgi:peptide/nickel transport system permease protein